MNISPTFIFLLVLPALAAAVEGPDSRFDYQEAMGVARTLQSQNLSIADLHYHTKDMQRMFGLDQAGMLLPSCLMQSQLTEKELQVFFDFVLCDGSAVRPDFLKACKSEKTSVWILAAGHILQYQLDENDPLYRGGFGKMIRSFFHDPRSYDQSCMDNHWLVFGAQVLFWGSGGETIVKDYIRNRNKAHTPELACEDIDAHIATIKALISDHQETIQNAVATVDAMLNSPGAQVDVVGWVRNAAMLNKALLTARKTMQSIRKNMEKLGI